MTIAVDLGRKATKQTKITRKFKHTYFFIWPNSYHAGYFMNYTPHNFCLVKDSSYWNVFTSRMEKSVDPDLDLPYYLNRINLGSALLHWYYNG